MWARYKPGDKVMVRPDIDGKAIYYMRDEHGNGVSGNKANDHMIDCAGKVFEIESIDFGQYRLKDFDHYWTDDMFFGPPDECICETLL